MSEPKLHHYVPQFYLRRFCDASGRLWAWDRDTDRVFATTPRSVAAEQSFYYLDVYGAQGHDPLTMEKQFAALEQDVARITDQWLGWIRAGEPGMRIEIPEPNRDLVSLFVSLQFLRTADTRDILARLASTASDPDPSKTERRRLHIEALWDGELVSNFSDRIGSATWIFGHNTTGVPFVTSDNPVAFRSSDNAKWLKAGVLSDGTYLVYPLAPDIVMYCHPPEGPWLKAARFDSCTSPVTFTPEMVQSENAGQVFMASRFVMSRVDDFAEERQFAPTIGTDVYAEYWRTKASPAS